MTFLPKKRTILLTDLPLPLLTKILCTNIINLNDRLSFERVSKICRTAAQACWELVKELNLELEEEEDERITSNVIFSVFRRCSKLERAVLRLNSTDHDDLTTTKRLFAVIFYFLKLFCLKKMDF